MTSVMTEDSTQIVHKDWGPKTAQPIAFQRR
jgi:hypothetical protein